MNNVHALESITKENKNYREVLVTTKQMQLVLMSIPYKQNIVMEVHPKTTQFVKVESGVGEAILNGFTFKHKTGDSVVVEPGMKHDFISLSRRGLKLYTIYSPPEHKPDALEVEKN